MQNYNKSVNRCTIHIKKSFFFFIFCCLKRLFHELLVPLQPKNARFPSKQAIFNMSIDSLEMPQELSSGLTPIAIPEATSSQTGVSVRYVPAPDKRWFVLRASYGREDVVSDLLIQTGHYAYVVKRYEWILDNGMRKRVLQSLIPNMVFTYLSPSDADMLVKDRHPGSVENPCPQLSYYASYYYDHTRQEGTMNPPVQIPDQVMLNFIQGTWCHDENIVALQKGDYHFLKDEMVEVIGGPFKGVRGRVIRAGGQRRVLLKLTAFNGDKVLGEFGTAFIPQSLMRPLI